MAALNNLPIKTVNGATIYVHDVAYVSDGFSPQINIARMDGQRGVILAIYKTGDASTLDVVSQIYARLPRHQASAAAADCHYAPVRPVDFRARGRSGRDSRRRGRRLPDGADDPAVPGQLAQHADHRHLHSAFDSGFHHRAERAARDHQPHDPRRAGARRRHPGGRRHGRDREHQPQPGAGQGHRSRHPRRRAARSPSRRWSRRCASASCLCPMFFLTGVAKFLFVPLAEAVVFAMLASYILSRTLVPTMAMYLLKGHHGEEHATGNDVFSRIQRGFAHGFERMRDGYRAALAFCLDHAWTVRRFLFLVFCVASAAAAFLLGARLLPLRGCRADPAAHARARRPARRRNRPRSDGVDNLIRRVIPPEDLGNDPRQHRLLQQHHQHDLQQLRRDRRIRRRNPDRPEAGAQGTHAVLRR